MTDPNIEHTLRPFEIGSTVDEFPRVIGERRYGSGCENSYDGAEFAVEVLAVFDHDHEGCHSFAQVWDYTEQDNPAQGWQYVLFLLWPERTYSDGLITGGCWSFRIVHDWGLKNPSFTTVGERVDAYITEPNETLRRLLR
jgi:hypothetical protein